MICISDDLSRNTNYFKIYINNIMTRVLLFIIFFINDNMYRV